MVLSKDASSRLFETLVRLRESLGRLELLLHQHLQVAHIRCMILQFVKLVVKVSIGDLHFEGAPATWLLLLLLLLHLRRWHLFLLLSITTLR